MLFGCCQRKRSLARLFTSIQKAAMQPAEVRYGAAVLLYRIAKKKRRNEQGEEASLGPAREHRIAQLQHHHQQTTLKCKL